MDIKRIEQIQKETAFPDSISVQQALLKVWNECEHKADDNSVLKSLHEDLTEFYQEKDFLTPEKRTGIAIAIDQVERYIRGDISARSPKH